MTTRIGLISDTHLPSVGRELPPQVARAFGGVDLILHAGDIYNIECLEQLALIAPVIAAEEGITLASADPRVKRIQFIEIEGHTIGLKHDFQFPGFGWEIYPGYIAARMPPTVNIPALVQEVFGRPLDTVIFGHTHYALAEKHQGTLIINPGSPTLPEQKRRLGQVAIMQLSATRHEGWVVDLKAM